MMSMPWNGHEEFQREVLNQMREMNALLRAISIKIDEQQKIPFDCELKKDYVPHCPVCKKPVSRYELDAEDGKSYLGRCDQCKIVFHSTPKEV